jgi:hypothetical protein
VPTLILAGDKGPRARWLPFAGEASDGIVGLEETRLHDVPHRTVSALHTFIMNDRTATKTIAHFLDSGSLDSGGAGDAPKAGGAAGQDAPEDVEGAITP